MPGLGAYTTGILNVKNAMHLYLYVGAHSKFNFMKNNGYFYSNGGASSDVRLNTSSNYDWSDPLSLRSRIMVAAGGGSAEWPGSVGGNAGGLIGGEGKSDCGWDGIVCPSIITIGSNQTSGGIASEDNIWLPGTSNQVKAGGFSGDFGRIRDFGSYLDIGGMGGNGYYSGATLLYAGGGSGGSSFISGHEGCIALNSSINENPSPTNSNIHYSGIYFTQTKMISGNETMPLYFSSTSKGRGNEYNGCIRITILSFLCTNLCNFYYIFQYFNPIIVLLIIDNK